MSPNDGISLLLSTNICHLAFLRDCNSIPLLADLSGQTLPTTYARRGIRLTAFWKSASLCFARFHFFGTYPITSSSMMFLTLVLLICLRKWTVKPLSAIALKNSSAHEIFVSSSGDICDSLSYAFVSITMFSSLEPSDLLTTYMKSGL